MVSLPAGWSLSPPSDLAQRVEWQESRGDQSAVSPKGASGVMQLMPGTMQDPGFGVRPYDFSTSDPESENRRMGQEYLSAMQQRYGGDDEAALVAYNWGPGNADKWVANGKPWNALPAETQGYVTNIMGGTDRPFGAVGAQPQGLSLPEGWTTEPPKFEPAGDFRLENKMPLSTPDQPQQKNYAWSEVPGAAISNVGNDAGTVLSGLKEAFIDHPVETAKTFVKTIIGSAQEFIPGQQEYETKYADPFYKKLFSDYGVTWDQQGNASFDQEQLKRTLAERPVQATLDASMVAAPAEAIPLRGARTVAGAARAVNPIYQAGRGVTTVAKRTVSPFPARQGTARAAAELAQEGVPTTAGQATGNKALKYAESEIGGSRTTNIIDNQNAAFTQAASRRIGIDSPVLDGPTMEAAYTRIGNEFNDIGRRNSVRIDNNLYRSANNALADYNRRTNPSQRVPMVEGHARDILAMRGNIDGDAYMSIRSSIGADARNTSDHLVQNALYQLQRGLDDAMDRSLRASGNAADVERLRTARRQYRNYLALEDAMAVGGQETAAGVLTPARLEMAASNRFGRRAYLHGSEFTDLAKSGKVAMTKMPESGTAARMMINAIPVALGALIGGGGTAGLGAAAGGIAGYALGGRLLMSRPVQGYLRNQLLAHQGSAVGRYSRNALVPATAAAPRTNELMP